MQAPEDSGNAPRATPRLLLLALLVLAALFAAGFAVFLGTALVALTGGGILWADGHPIGADFINLRSVALLTLSGEASAIYPAAEFEAFVTALAGGDVGMRVWAYPPHSLFFAWPFGFLDYFAALAIWSMIGLAVLAFGARAYGFTPLEVAIIAVSPAALLNIYFGQTGNIATGLLLMALAPRVANRLSPAIAAALLTMKPQIGFLLPLVWLVRRAWRPIALAALLALALIAASILAFGLDPWRDYLGSTLPALAALEHHGTGPFMGMIPSAFMALRLLTGDPDFAVAAHSVFALLIFAVFAFRLVRLKDETRQAVLLIAATALISPYLHIYDLAMVFCAGLIAARRWTSGWPAIGMGLYVVVLWALPILVIAFALFGWPLSPLVILPLLLLA